MSNCPNLVIRLFPIYHFLVKLAVFKGSRSKLFRLVNRLILYKLVVLLLLGVMGLLIRVCGENEFVHDFEYAFDNLRDGPLKNVHVTWQDIWVCCLLKLLDRETLVFKSDVGSLVLKNIAVVRG